MEGTATYDESNKENIPPVCTNGEKKKNPIPPMASSFKRNGKRKIKRVPLADITNLVNDSAQELNGVSAIPSALLLLHCNSRRRTPVLLRGSRSLRLGFR
ncbi:hypothetical protein E2542_SST26339 [Spatholobus suberectus]|nr:hypothetical protein E2542_SST26339 [Spatholobus suberectus]